MGFKVKMTHTPLPTDRRRKPWPCIRYYKLKVKTTEEFAIEMLKIRKKEGEEELKNDFNKTFWGGGEG
jgi:hypothetical protein